MAKINPYQKYLKGEEIPEDPCEFWESIDWEKAVGKHSPLYQPCIDIKLVYVFTVLYNSKFHYLEYLRNTINSKCSNYNLRAIYASYAIAILITDDPYGNYVTETQLLTLQDWRISPSTWRK